MDDEREADLVHTDLLVRDPSLQAFAPWHGQAPASCRRASVSCRNFWQDLQEKVADYISSEVAVAISAGNAALHRRIQPDPVKGAWFRLAANSSPLSDTPTPWNSL